MGQNGVALMPRRRSLDPTTAISITLKRTLLDKIDDELTRTSSRSGWIASACEDKLAGGGIVIADAPSIQLLTVILNRGHMTENMYYLVRDYIKLETRRSEA